MRRSQALRASVGPACADQRVLIPVRRVLGAPAPETLALATLRPVCRERRVENEQSVQRAVAAAGEAPQIQTARFRLRAALTPSLPLEQPDPKPLLRAGRTKSRECRTRSRREILRRYARSVI